MKPLFLLLFFVLVLQSSYAQKNRDVQRTFKENIFKATNSFAPDDYDLFRAVIFTYSSKSGKQYVYDYSQKNLFGINFNDKKVTELFEIGKGVGSGPGEFRNPTDICINKTDDGEKLVIIDTDLSRVSIWNIESNIFENSFKPKKFSPFRVACTSTDIVIFNTLGSERGDFLVYDYKGIEKQSFKDSKKGKSPFLDSGYIEADSQFIYYVSQGKPLIRSIDRESKKVLERTIIESSLKENKASKSAEGDYIVEKRDKNFVYQSRGIELYQDYLIVLHSGRKDAFGNILDFYEKSTLEYQFSSKIDLFSQQMSISGNVLLVRGFDQEQKTTVFKYYTLHLD